jgi:hypothetical protein
MSSIKLHVDEQQDYSLVLILILILMLPQTAGAVYNGQRVRKQQEATACGWQGTEGG